MKQVFYLLLLIGLHTCVFAQPEAQSLHIKIQEHTPHSPNTASLGRYFDIPVDMSSGIPTITIPLYTIKTGNTSIPISLTYHAAGNRVNTSASWVGMGWDLVYGGVVTKQVNGLDDFYSGTFYDPATGTPSHTNYFNPDYTIDDNLGFTSMSDVGDSLLSGTYASTYFLELSKLLGRIILNKYDGESDEYHYSTPQGSGSIFYNQKTSQFHTNKLDGSQAFYLSNDNNWIVRTKDGFSFRFGQPEETLTQVRGVGQYYTSAWYITSITDNMGREVSYQYDVSDRKHYKLGEWQNRDYQFGGPFPTFSGTNGDYIRRYGRDINVRTINFPEGRIEFIKEATTRIDSGINALKQIKIFDQENVLKKQFNLEYIYVGTAGDKTARLFLKSVQEINVNTLNANASRPYIIDYESTVLPTNFSFAQDKWGYYNGKLSNTSMQPMEVETVSYGIPNLANREIDTNYTKASIIKKIQYPTGGSISFDFENNKDENNALVGGVRVKRITNFDHVGNQSLIKEYNYNDDAGNSTGYVHSRPKFHYFLQKGMTPPVSNCRVTSDPILPLFTNQGSPIIYKRVDEIQKGNGVDLKTRYYYHFDLGQMGISESVEATVGLGVPQPKKSAITKFLAKPYKIEKFKKENNQYVVVEQTELDYNLLDNLKNYIWNIQSAWTLFSSSFVEDPGNDPYSVQNMMNTTPTANMYKMFQESLVNNETTQKIFNGSDVITSVTHKQFDKRNENVNTVTAIASNGDILNTYVKYVSDYNYTTSSNTVNLELNSLMDEGRTGLPIEVISTRQRPGGQEYITAADLYFYNAGQLRRHLRLPNNNNNILYSGYQVSSNDAAGFYYDNRYEEETRIDFTDNYNNPTQLTTKNKVQSIIWDIDDILATAENASIADIAATSFESAVKGQWTYSGAPVSEANALTGKKAYLLTNGNITRSTLDANKTYIVSYWSKNGAQSVSGGSNITTGRTLNQWTYYEHQVVNPSTGLVTISGTGTIDELRLYPAGALMKTYTYEPLLGMSSQCEVNNRLSYYEYDYLSRLHLVKDDEGKVLKRICYNYAGQVENCGVLYYSTAKSGTFTRNNCGTGFIGGSVTYTVPANTFSAESQAAADALAQADVDANGQAYANANGTCTPVSTTIYVKIAYQNFNYGPTVTADVVLKFYNDAAGTIPVSVSNLNVNVESKRYNCGSTTAATTLSYTFNCSGTSTVVMTQANMSLQDARRCWEWTYTVKPGTGYTP